MRAALLALVLPGCLLGAPPDDSPIAVYDHVWADFDAHYGLFGVKADTVDWDALYADCLPLVPASQDDAALQEALRCLLGPLNDDHVRLLVPGVEDGLWSAGRLQDLESEDFHEEVSGAYVQDLVDAGPLRWGWLSEDVGYLHLRSLSSQSAARGAAEAMQALGGARAIALDLRGNGGGLHSVLEPVASLFSDRDYVYSRLRRREGAARDSYGEWIDYDVEAGEAPFLGPVALLTHAFTVSGAENLTLALGELEPVTQVGSTTAGAFAGTGWRDAPNGWLYAVSLEDVRDAEGLSYEGVGLAPDIEAASTLEDTRAGRDLALEAALEWLD